MAKKKKRTEKGLRKIWGILFFALFLFSLLGLFSYDWRDIGILQTPPNDPTANFIGLIGAWLSFILFSAFGVGAYLTPLWCLVLGSILLLDEEQHIWPRVSWATAAVLMLVLSVELNPPMWAEVSDKLNMALAPGGVLGWLIMEIVLVKWLSSIGAGILVWSVFCAAMLMLVGANNLARGFWVAVGFCGSLIQMVQDRRSEGEDKRKMIERREREIEKQRKRLEKKLQKQEKQDALQARKDRRDARKAEPEPEVKPPEKEKKPKLRKPVKEPAKEVMAVTDSGPISDYKLPSIDLLDAAPAQAVNVDVDTTKRILIDTLADFGIEAEITNVEKGPVVTRYEILPAAGVRVERIAGLANNLALSLKSHNVRVQAPVPGKGVVGVEVPNLTANMVNIRHVIESEEWISGKAHIPLAMGQDVGGNVIVADLASMPHLLVAGATGAGKTVCMNTLLTGLLMSKSPDELKLMLVDPKIVEFAMYNDLPHLVVPVITDPKKVALGLRWAINEMEKRYKLFAKVGVRNIEGYNTREVATQVDLFNGNEGAETKKSPPAKIPYIAIIIDELADLMLVDQAEIENCVARLAQLSRAVGIHMILSTQRPSVNVITGTIKANFPARVAFQVAQKTDSRTILDAGGAEKLLGKGDMLFLLPGANKMIRTQGAWTSDGEMQKVVDFVKAQAGPSFEMEIKEKLEKKVMPGSVDTGEDDELLTQAIEIIRETQRASTSSLQRRLRIGYTRAARMIDILEERGIVGPPRGSDPREILVDLDAGIPDNAQIEEADDEAQVELAVSAAEDAPSEEGEFVEEINYVSDDEEVIVEDSAEKRDA